MGSDRLRSTRFAWRALNQRDEKRVGKRGETAIKLGALRKDARSITTSGRQARASILSSKRCGSRLDRDRRSVRGDGIRNDEPTNRRGQRVRTHGLRNLATNESCRVRTFRKGARPGRALFVRARSGGGCSARCAKSRATWKRLSTLRRTRPNRGARRARGPPRLGARRPRVRRSSEPPFLPPNSVRLRPCADFFCFSRR